MISPEDYLATLLARLAPTRLGSETVPVSEGLGRVLANDVVARLSVPPFSNSAMDGFAVKVADFAGDGPWRFPVTADIAAGDEAGADRGGVARIMTGAPLPGWATAVVKVEDTDAPAGASATPAEVTIAAKPGVGLNVRHAGEDIEAGEILMEAGTRLTSRGLSSLVSIGYADVDVTRRPRVAVLATGSELVAPGEPVGPGQIPDSNTTLISNLVREAGGEPVEVRTVADTADAFGEALARAASAADLIVTSGGVSMGAFDPVKEYGLEHGFTFEKVAMQPGKPQGHGVVSDAGRSVGVISLPGNPVSVAVSFTLFALPVIDVLLTGESNRGTLPARAGVSWRKKAGRRQYLPAQLRSGKDGVEVVPVHALGSKSHLVAALYAADVLAVVPADVEEINEGDMLDVVSFP